MITSVLRRYRQPLFIGVVAIFLIGIFVGLGGYYFSGAGLMDVVAVVGGEKILYSRFRSRINQYLDSVREKKGDVTAQMENEVKQAMLRDMIVDELLAQEAEKLGFRVTDMELSLGIQNTPAFQREGRFSQDLYFQAVRYTLKTTPEQFEAEQRRSMLAAKLKSFIARGAKVPPAEIREEYLRENKGSDKDFEKKKEEFASGLRQRRALEAINAYLRQLGGQVEIRTYLDQREQGG
ncbi:MAG: SurA N-terminal domain-containing protein [Elusimicrobia bacterium]|nr:SurA N-terminal domain-containing protein [Elusimicrobiota bacterium]